MTGEITLRGEVLPIGGVKEKILAALRLGVRVVLLPAENERDLADLPPKARRQARIRFVRNVGEVLGEALVSNQLPASPAQPERKDAKNRKDATY
jgi:ATP-dependent Lon protease